MARMGGGEEHSRLAWFEAMIGVDVRSLALMRISLGGLLCWDLVGRLMDLTTFYSDGGVLPTRDALALALGGQWSLHTLSGHPAAGLALLVVALVFALMLTVGLWTRLATVVSWLLLVSLHVRNPHVLIGGDIMLRLMLFWGIFLPLGARASVDAAAGRMLPRGVRVASMASLAILLQLVFVYVFTAALKTGPEWQRDYTAVGIAVASDGFGTPLGAWLGQWPGVTAWLTQGTYWLEWLGPVVAFSPIFHGPLRTLATFLFIGLHVGMGLTMELGPFPAICIAAWTVFLPGWFWDRVGARFAVTWAVVSTAVLERVRRLVPPILWSGRPPMVPSAGMTRLTEIGLLGLVLLVTLWNLGTVVRTREHIPRPLRMVTRALGLDQQWRMFAPSPARLDRWFVFAGEREDGSLVDVYRPGQPVLWERPERVSVAYRSLRWRKYLSHLGGDGKGDDLASFLCRQWNAQAGRDQDVRSVSVYMLGGAGPEPPVVGRHRCKRAQPG